MTNEFSDNAVLDILKNKNQNIKKAKASTAKFMQRIKFDIAEDDPLIKESSFIMTNMANVAINYFIHSPHKNEYVPSNGDLKNFSTLHFFSNDIAINRMKEKAKNSHYTGINLDSKEYRQNRLNGKHHFFLKTEYKDYRDITGHLPYFMNHIHHYSSGVCFFNDYLMQDTYDLIATDIILKTGMAKNFNSMETLKKLNKLMKKVRDDLANCGIEDSSVGLESILETDVRDILY